MNHFLFKTPLLDYLQTSLPLRARYKESTRYDSSKETQADPKALCNNTCITKTICQVKHNLRASQFNSKLNTHTKSITH